MTETREFRPVSGASRAARLFAADILAGLDTSVLGPVLLIVSELASNAVHHAGSSFQVTIDHVDGTVRVEVTDAGPGQPAMREPGPHEPSGRGLQIVDNLANDWGVIEDARGKTVWAILRTPPSDGDGGASVQADDASHERSAGGGATESAATSSDDAVAGAAESIVGPDKHPASDLDPAGSGHGRAGRSGGRSCLGTARPGSASHHATVRARHQDGERSVAGCCFAHAGGAKNSSAIPSGSRNERPEP